MQKIERFLRIDGLGNTSDIMRARAIYMISIAFIGSQMLNLALMTYTYGSWTIDHWVSVVAVLSVGGVVCVLRFTKKFIFFSAFYSILIFIGVGVSARVGFSGINSALLPFIVCGVIINGFVSGWRAVGVYCVAGIVFTLYLYNISAGAPTGALFDPALFYARNFQRAAQLIIALCLTSFIIGYASHRMHSAFFLLEERVDFAERSQREKSEFFANMSHELRTPLNGIIGFCDLLEKTNLEPKQEKYATIITKSSNILLAIVNDALEMAKMDAGKALLKSDPVDLSSLMDSVADLYLPIADKKGLALKVNFPAGHHKMYEGDEHKIRQVLNNLVNNAIKFTPNGVVAMTLEPQKKGTRHNIKIHVQDSGIGIPKDALTTVFDRFKQVDNSMTRETQGTGLGLAICKEIVEQMGGTLNVASQLGHGSIFTISLHLEGLYSNPIREAAA